MNENPFVSKIELFSSAGTGSTVSLDVLFVGDGDGDGGVGPGVGSGFGSGVGVGSGYTGSVLLSG